MRTHTRTAHDTEDLGRQLATGRPTEIALAVLYLCGELGSGKTTFARGFLRGCGVPDTVRSPTYTLLELYPAGALTVVHLDLYRLREPAELEALGVRDYASPGHLWLIEWPQRAQSRLPAPDLRLDFTVGADGHDITVQAQSPLGERWLQTARAGAA